MPYGIANRVAAPSFAGAVRVVEAALECGIRFFDTAQAYGKSEAFLGAAFRELGSTGCVQVISKLDLALNPTDPGAVLRSVEASVERLESPLWAILLHRADWLGVWEQGLGSALVEAQRRGLVRYLGVSVYTVDEARRVLAHQAMQVVQAPFNAWDQRTYREGVFQLTAARDKLCFVRSVFLQGLLTLPLEAAASRLWFARTASGRWDALARRFAVPREELAVRCALALAAPVVVGMETVGQVRANARLFELEPLSVEEMDEIHTAMAGVIDERILNPSRWQERV
jgi:aryl-alcohol dehydrogenase-like predicted oxidoreductase